MASGLGARFWVESGSQFGLELGVLKAWVKFYKIVEVRKRPGGNLFECRLNVGYVLP